MSKNTSKPTNDDHQEVTRKDTDRAVKRKGLKKEASSDEPAVGETRYTITLEDFDEQIKVLAEYMWNKQNEVGSGEKDVSTRENKTKNSKCHANKKAR